MGGCRGITPRDGGLSRPFGDGRLPGLRYEDGGAVEAAGLQVGEGPVGVVERVLVRGDGRLVRAALRSALWQRGKRTGKPRLARAGSTRPAGLTVPPPRTSTARGSRGNPRATAACRHWRR